MAAFQTSEFAVARGSSNETITLRRGLALSALFGMGLTEERLECGPEQISFTGMERQALVLRWLKVTKLVKIRDVLGIHEVRTSIPVFLILAIMAFFSAIANAADFYWWFDLQVWRLSYLWGLSLIGDLFASSSDWIAAHVIVGLFWLGIWLLFRRHYILIDVSESSKIWMRTKGIAPELIQNFLHTLNTRWSAAKAMR